MNRFLLFSLLCLYSVAGSAAGVQDMRALERIAKTFAAGDDGSSGFQYQAGNADLRLRLPACTQTPEAAWPAAKPPYQAVALSCGEQGWRVLIPVTATANSTGYAATRQLRAGTVVQAGDIKLIHINNRSLALQAVRDPSLIVGKAVRSTVAADSLLRENQLQAPIVVKMNQPLRAVVEGDGFSIAGDAIALGNAAVGERVNVRVSSGKVVSGIVREDLTVLLNAP